jgi:hypothetical protein
MWKIIDIIVILRIKGQWCGFLEAEKSPLKKKNFADVMNQCARINALAEVP